MQRLNEPKGGAWRLPRGMRGKAGGPRGRNYPTIISCKTGIREGQEQADLEGRVPKGIFPGTIPYIVMEDDAETLAMKSRIGSCVALGIDAIFTAKAGGSWHPGRRAARLGPGKPGAHKAAERDAALRLGRGRSCIYNPAGNPQKHGTLSAR